MKFIELEHIWTKEKRMVPIETVTPTYISIRWGQSGTYDLNIAKNVLTARSQKAQRKGKSLWHASDIKSIRKFIYEKYSGKDNTEVVRRMVQHLLTMPDANPRIENLGSGAAND